MDIKMPAYDVGVVVARFQTHKLHDGHIELLDTVTKNHKKVILFLGLSPLRGSVANPLDFETRKQMILQSYPQISVLYIRDTSDDNFWSRKLDEMIADVVSPTQTAVLYGSRDSFIERYHGKYPTIELEATKAVSGQEIRKQLASHARNSEDFRAGVIHGALNQYPKCLATVDVAIMKDEQILLGRKPYETKFRLIGGFSDPTSPSYEADARREAMEETNVEISDPQYLGSYLVPDWRYAPERDKIKTLLFKAHYMFGAPSPGDDISELKWFDLRKITKDMVVETHHELLDRVVADFVKTAVVTP